MKQFHARLEEGWRESYAYIAPLPRWRAVCGQRYTPTGMSSRLARWGWPRTRSRGPCTMAVTCWTLRRPH